MTLSSLTPAKVKNSQKFQISFFVKSSHLIVMLFKSSAKEVLFEW